MAVERYEDSEPGAEWPKPAPARVKGSAIWLILVAVAALFGAIFSAVSTADFIQHLDGQMHSIHCSFIPGASATLGESGCRTVMLSPYSSFFRDRIWGGLPVSLLSLAVFSYLAARALDFAFKRDASRKETGFMLLAAVLPAMMSAIFLYIAEAKVGAVCKLCVGVYLSSAGVLGFSVLAHLKADAAGTHTSPVTAWTGWFLQGVLYVGVLAGLYLLLAPVDHKRAEGCGQLVKTDDPSGVLVPLAPSGGRPSVAVLDPLCPACKAFDQRLEASGLIAKLDLKTVLFPLDSSCNWMVKTSLHPGACAVSEAILCRKEDARAIMAWAFAEQDSLRAMAEKDDAAVRRRIVEKFPAVQGCLGSPRIKNALNKSLRWAVANALPVLTPQLFIGDARVCDEDTDLGLEYTVTAMLDRGTLRGRAR